MTCYAFRRPMPVQSALPSLLVRRSFVCRGSNRAPYENHVWTGLLRTEQVERQLLWQVESFQLYMPLESRLGCLVQKSFVARLGVASLFSSLRDESPSDTLLNNHP